jgi:16S rRNA (adenine1518-N6/adenine1519-N6)-dimethyltransferase
VRHIYPRRAFGQSFLTYEPVADELVAALGVRPDDTVLEVGPGKGMLTRRLVGMAAKVIAVEIDERLAQGLRAEMGGRGDLEVVQADFMEFDLGPFRHLKVMGTLPYNLLMPGTWQCSLPSGSSPIGSSLHPGPGPTALCRSSSTA